MQKSLIIESVDTNGVKKQKSIANINPEASNADCGEFAQRLTALSTNTYTGASVIKKMGVDEEDSGSGSTGKKIPTLTIGEWVND